MNSIILIMFCESRMITKLTLSHKCCNCVSCGGTLGSNDFYYRPEHEQNLINYVGSFGSGWCLVHLREEDAAWSTRMDTHVLRVPEQHAFVDQVFGEL